MGLQELVLDSKIGLKNQSWYAFCVVWVSPKIDETTMHSYWRNVGTYVCSSNAVATTVNLHTPEVLLVHSGQSVRYSEQSLQIERV
jgi:hypothetical protein